MGPENIMLSEISQSEKDKPHITSLICGICRTNMENGDRLIDGEQEDRYVGGGYGWRD